MVKHLKGNVVTKFRNVTKERTFSREHRERENARFDVCVRVRVRTYIHVHVPTCTLRAYDEQETANPLNIHVSGVRRVC